MGKLVILDECLVPRRLTWLNYKGPNSIDFLKGFRKTLRFTFDVSTTRCLERKLLWDYTGDPIRFYNEWLVRKEVSRFTEIHFTIRALGYVSKAKKDGDFSLELYGELENKFEPSNWFMKYIWLMYNYVFYNKLRENYVVTCRDYLNSFLNWCKEKYGMKTVNTPEATMEEMVAEQQSQKLRQMAQRAAKSRPTEPSTAEKEAPREEHQSESQ
jgi:hypothetical protein